MSGFTHFDAQGNAIMVDVTDKNITERCATASGCIRVSRADKGHHRFCYGRGDLHDPLFLYGKIIRAYRRGDGGTDRGERGTAYHL